MKSFGTIFLNENKIISLMKFNIHEILELRRPWLSIQEKKKKNEKLRKVGGKVDLSCNLEYQ